jgi:hypothetical protein
MTTAQFLTIIGILSSIEATLAGFTGWPHTAAFLLGTMVNCGMYLAFKFLLQS